MMGSDNGGNYARGRSIRTTQLFFLISITLLSALLWKSQNLIGFVRPSRSDDEVKYILNSSLSSDSKYISTHTLDYATCKRNNIVPNNWCIDSDQTPRYVGKTEYTPQVIQHYTHDGYDKCLAEKTVVFIGDSRVRYQFNHLAAFLKFKRFMKCEDYIDMSTSGWINWLTNHATPDSECYLINHPNFKKGWATDERWYQLFSQSTALLDTNETESQQSGLCDCYREQQFDPERIYENRYIKRSTRFGETNLIYLQNLEGNIRLNQEYPPFAPFDSPTPERCKPGECGEVNRTNAFVGDLNATLWEILPRLNTTHAFINLGWEHINGFEQQSEFTCAMRDFERSYPDIKLFLISHPPPTDALDNPVVNFDATKLKCDIDVLDRTSMNKKIPLGWYWDRMHVNSIVNEEYNHQMIEKVCPIKG